MDKFQELWKERQEALEERERRWNHEDNVFYFMIGLVTGLALSAGFIFVMVTVVR